MQAAGTLTLADAVFPRFASESKALSYARDLTLMVGFALFVALCAQFVVRVPWTTVPITGQTFAVLVTGGALGAWRGAGSLAIYMVMGMLVPVYAPATSGLTGSWDLHPILPWMGTEALPINLSSGGYIVGFIFAAGLVGWLSQRGWDRKAWVHVGMLLGSLVIYAFGIAWLAYLIASGWSPPGATVPLSEMIAGSDTLDKTLKGGLYPFIVGDLMKLQLAAIALPSAWALVDRLQRRR
jgi:biotin transport system substrate-specific component